MRKKAPETIAANNSQRYKALFSFFSAHEKPSLRQSKTEKKVKAKSMTTFFTVSHTFSVNFFTVNPQINNAVIYTSNNKKSMGSKYFTVNYLSDDLMYLFPKTAEYV